MSYSSWSESFWFTCESTGAFHIDGARLFVNPKRGESKHFTYLELTNTKLDQQWVSLNFPDAPMHFLSSLLFFVDAFITDMETNRYKYSGYKEPNVGINHDPRSVETSLFNSRYHQQQQP